MGSFPRQVLRRNPIPVTTPLTARESEVLHLIAWGFTNKQISAQLEIKVKTVEAHKSNGMRKLRFSKRSEVVRYALEQGWLVLQRPAESESPSG